MILDKIAQAITAGALKNGVRIDVQTKDEPLSTNEAYNQQTHVDSLPDLGTSAYPEAILGEASLDKYKLPFFFVTGILIGAALGLRVQKVVVIK